MLGFAFQGDIADIVLIGCWITVFVAIVLLIILPLKDKNTKLEINGVRLGDMFSVLCETEDFKVIIDKETKYIYIMSEDGITPLLNSNGKPKKYKEFSDVIRKSDK